MIKKEGEEYNIYKNIEMQECINIDRIESIAYLYITSIPTFLLIFPFAIAHYMFELAHYAFKLNRYCLAICLKSIVMRELATINLSLLLRNNLFE